MHASHFLTLLSLAASSLAITITGPSLGAAWSSSGPNTVTWTSVSTDPTTFAVTLVQQGVYKQTLADSVDGTKGTLSVTATLPVGSTYQVNFVKSSQDLSSILAQSAQFNITQGTGSSSASSSGSSSSASASASTSGRTVAAASTSAASGTDIPNAASGTALNPTDSATPKPNAASLSAQYHGGLLGVFALLGLALI